MGTGCSTMKHVRKTFRKNTITAKSLTTENNSKGSFSDTKGDDGDEAREEDDELDALSPISGTIKTGSGGTRGLSAASTVLPGTSISISPVMEELSELESCKPLPDLDEFPDDIRNLLLGRCSTHDPNKNRRLSEIFLLVLANGTDGYRFFSEVNKMVIPSLKQLCFENASTLHIYVFGHQSVPCGKDFRMLITNFVTSLLKFDKVITLTIFGRPLTVVQPPDVILQSDFDAAVSRMSSADNRELVHCSYAADVNAISPCYRLIRHNHETEDRIEQDANIISILESAFDDKAQATYLTSVFEDVLRILQESKNDDVHNRSFLIHLESTIADEEKSRKEDVRVQHLISDWEDKLPDEYKFNFFNGDSWEELWNGNVSSSEVQSGTAFRSLEFKLRNVLYTIFEQNVDEIRCFVNEAGRSIETQLLNELIHQQSEIHSHLRSFQDRPDLLSSVMNYIAGPQNHPLVVHGRQGRGKSALLAVAAVLCGGVFPTMPVLIRSAGSSPESFTQEQILRSVCEQLAILYGDHPSLASRSIAEHNSFFSALLRRARSERPLLIILDGLDQVEEYSGRSLKWYPNVLPEHVKLILAFRDGSNELQELQERFSGEKSTFLEVPDMEIDDTMSIIQHQMRLRGRRLTDTQMSFARICVTENSYPRYAHIFAQVACTWFTLAIPEKFWSKHSLIDIFCDYISYVSNTVDLKVLNRFFSILVTLKQGLMESEISHVLQTKTSSSNDDKLVFIFMKYHMAPFLRTSVRRGHSFIQLRSQIFRKLCKTYLGTQSLEDCLQYMLQYLQNNTQIHLMQNRTGEIKTNHKHQRWRELEETTHLQIKLNISVRKYFFDHIWLFERMCSGDPYLLLEEIKMYKRRNPDDREFEILRKFLQLSAYALRHDGRQLYTQLYGRVKGYFDEPENSIKYPTMKKLFQISAIPPVPSFHSSGPCLRTLADAQKAFPKSSRDPYTLDIITWLDKEARHFVTYCSGTSEISAWKTNHMKKMATLGEMTCIDNINALGRQAEVVLLHHDRMEVFDLAKNVLKIQMVELIDVSQGIKLLDGGKNVLAISANRDEILKFDTTSGHVVRRITLGENRYMNASLYTGN
ncbi:uncharacterized protein LOC118193179 isoform X2 [Stegodyphus dumicola]|uniref:uncharacterized protein LOC118193179 isoform X2 n=1 Tax=Stegodyphus dumicola TaxID=202533 RepID=UPI0015B290E1|nr:uncharacterized protein LOC118193179 isoform X2 [Stegodyphus dumicola]